MTRENEHNSTLDVFKYVAAMLIMGTHAMPLTENEAFNLYYSQWFFRFCVPLFFLSTGYYFARMDAGRKKKYIVRIFFLCIISHVLYIPGMIGMGIPEMINSLLYGFAHLWYLNALGVSLVILYALDHLKAFDKVSPKWIAAAALLLLFVGAYFDEYYHLTYIRWIRQISAHIESHGTTRHALFFAVPLLLIGKCIYMKKGTLDRYLSTAKILIGLGVSALIALVECTLLIYLRGTGLSCDITLFNWIPAVFILLLSFRIHIPLSRKIARSLRKQADVIYIIHVMILEILKLYHFAYWTRYFTALLICNAIGLLVQLVFSLKRRWAA